MKFKESPYYNKEFLGQNLYDLISDNDEVLTVQEFFNINNVQNEYDIKGLLVNYNLKIYDYYYEFNCQSHKEKLYLVFDKPVRITGEYCIRVIAPEIIIVEKSTSNFLSSCVSNSLTVDYKYDDLYVIRFSKINNVYFYRNKIQIQDLEINNLFIFDKNLDFYGTSLFLDYHKIKCFGFCRDLKSKISEYKHFKKGIIHIE